MAARWYNPGNGQFTTTDPAANNPVPDSANANPFAYVADNPLGNVDPTGHSLWGKIKSGLKAVAKVVVAPVVHALVSAWNFVAAAATWVYHQAVNIVKHPASLYDAKKVVHKVTAKAVH